MYIRSISAGCFAAAIACSATSAFAQPITIQEDAAQLQTDRAALARENRQLQADEANWKSDRLSGRMAAESKDAYIVEMARTSIQGERKDLATDSPGSLQMHADQDALRREMKQLQVAETTLQNDAQAGRMAAQSADSERAYRDEQAVTAERKQIDSDLARLASDRA